MSKKLQSVQYLKSKKLKALLIVLCIVIIGGVVAYTFAKSPSATIEPEDSTTSGPVLSCEGIASSGSKHVKFGTSKCIFDTRKYTNPIKTLTPDPGVFKYENKYYMVYTTGTPTFWIFSSDDLVTWTWTFGAVFDGTHPWGIDKFWAPEIHQVGNKFAVYYTASDGNKLRIGVATADTITGPYTDLGQPLVSEAYGVIDANFFKDENGKQYLYWKEDEGNTRIFGQELNASGTALVGQKIEVLRKGLAWEGVKGIEAPWVMKRNGQYYMYYSGELYSSSAYAIGVARSSNPLGTYTKKGNPILTSGTRWKGPGHNSIVHIGINDYIVYHAWDTNPGSGERDALVDKIIWQNDWPTISGSTPSETQQNYPQ